MQIEPQLNVRPPPRSEPPVIRPRFVPARTTVRLWRIWPGVSSGLAPAPTQSFLSTRSAQVGPVPSQEPIHAARAGSSEGRLRVSVTSVPGRSRYWQGKRLSKGQTTPGGLTVVSPNVPG